MINLSGSNTTFYYLRFNLSEEECGSIKDALTFIALDSFTKKRH